MAERHASIYTTSLNGSFYISGTSMRHTAVTLGTMKQMKPAKQSPAGRVCLYCPTILSRYNHSPVCCCCERINALGLMTA